MSARSRARFAAVGRRHDGDLAEAALLCGVEADPELDVEVALLRLDALADGVRRREPRGAPPPQQAELLAAELAGVHGFTGDRTSYHDPDNSLLHRVLDRRRGLPLTLSILYVAIAQRVGIAAFPVALPGHVVTAVATDDRPVVLDPFHAGIRLDEAAIEQRVAATTGGQVAYHRAMLRPTSTPVLLRRLLNNLTRDLVAADRPDDARWAVELKLLLPTRQPEDHRALGELLTRTGRFDAAAQAYERYLELTGGHSDDAEAVRRAAIGARARLN